MTTVRLNEDTKKELEIFKKEFQASSYDETISKMMEQARKKISMFGADPDLPSWSEDDRKELRTDRH